MNLLVGLIVEVEGCSRLWPLLVAPACGPLLSLTLYGYNILFQGHKDAQETELVFRQAHKDVENNEVQIFFHQRPPVK